MQRILIALIVLIACVVVVGTAPVLADYYASKQDYLNGVLTPGDKPVSATPKDGSDDCTSPPVIADLTNGFMDSGDTAGGTSSISILPMACNGLYRSAAGTDNIYQFTLGAAGSVTVTVSTPDDDFDISTYVVSTCGDGDSCVIGADDCLSTEEVNEVNNGMQFSLCPNAPSGDSTETFDVTNVGAGTYYLYVDSWYPGDDPDGRGEGRYDLVVTGTLPVQLLEFSID